MSNLENKVKKTKKVSKSKNVMVSSPISADVIALLDNPYTYSNKISTIKLEKLLRKLSHVYYNTGKSLIPDEIFDIVKDILEKRDPQNIFLKEVGAPISKDKVKLPYIMASLDKIKPTTNALERWVNKFKGPYTLSDKLDGVSALLHFSKNGMQLYTRGDGIKGQNISHLMTYVLPEGLKKSNIPVNTAVRGELIISKKNFEKIKDDMKNARTAVSGLVNSKNISKRMHITEITDFVAYEIVNPRYKFMDQMKLMDNYGFNVVKNKTRKIISNNYLSEYLMKRRKDGDYEVDGIVVEDNSKIYQVENKNPTYGFAFKTILTDQVAETTVVDVIWNVSMSGYLKPKLKVMPVEIGGTTITYITAHNARNVVDKVLGPGSVITVIRSGDVIPKIQKIIKKASNGKPKLPEIPYKWNKTKVDFIVKDLHGAQKDNITMRVMDHFFKKLGVKYISEGIIKILVNNGYTTIPSIITMDINKASNIDGIGEKVLKKINTNIKLALSNTTLSLFMSASHKFGRGLGTKKLKLITNIYPNIMNEQWSKDETIQKVKELDGFDTLTATKFAENFAEFKKFFNEINKAIDISYLETPKKIKNTGNNIFKDQSIVLTGFRSKDIEKFIEDNGGNIKSSVSSNTDLVIFVTNPGDLPGSKLKKALKLKIDTISRTEFEKKYKL